LQIETLKQRPTQIKIPDELRDGVGAQHCLDLSISSIIAAVAENGAENGTASTSPRWRRRSEQRSSEEHRTTPLRIVLGNRSLTWLLVAFAGVTVGEWAYVTALAVDAFRRDGAIAVGLVGLRVFFAAASSLLSPILIRRRTVGPRLLTQIAFLRVVGLAASAALAAAGAPLAPLLVLLVLDAVVSAQYRPVQSALIPTMARTPREFVATAAELSTAKTLAQAIGSVLGGVLLAVTSPAAVFSGVAMVFLASGWITFRMSLGRSVQRSKDHSSDRPAAPGFRSVMHDTLSAVRNGYVAGILVVSGLRTFVRGMWISITVIASIKLLHAGSAGVGLLMLAAGVGSLVAAPISSRLVTRPKLGTPAAIAFVACGLPLAAIAGLPVFEIALALVVAWGIGMALTDVATTSILYRLVETPVVPRVTGTIESTKLALEGLGGFIGPVLAETIGIRPTLLIAAFPLPLVVVGGWKLLHRVDASATERAATLELLHGVHCLQPLDTASVDSLVGRLVRLEIAAKGTDVISQGDKGDGFYIVESGSAEVIVEGFTVGVLEAGDSFGERALLRDVPRTATVRSRTPMQLLMLSREDFLEALTGQADGQISPSPPTVLTGDREWGRRERVELLSRLNLFSHLDSKAVEALADRSVVEQWPEGATVVRQGDEGDRFFVMLDGRAEVAIDAVPVNELLPGDQFGEIALLHGVVRSADVVASSPIVTLSLSREDFLPSVRSQVLSG
jgi:CRP-like cAMP-binding protein/predicted MFS family arabinose efflux permease